MSQMMGNWKSPGPDKVYGFGVKRITCLHTDLTRNYILLVQNPDSVHLAALDVLTHLRKCSTRKSSSKQTRLVHVEHAGGIVTHATKQLWPDSIKEIQPSSGVCISRLFMMTFGSYAPFLQER